MRVQKFFQHHSLLSGLVLVFLFTWPVDLAHSKILPFQLPPAAYLFVGWGFIFASLIMTGVTSGRTAIVDLLKGYLHWRVGWRWYLVAFLFFPGLSLLAASLNAWLYRIPLDFGGVYAYRIFGPSARLAVLVLPFFLFDAISNGEEMGWRGYVLPRLQSKHSPLVASLILGTIWGLWHLPRYLSPDMLAIFPLFVVQMMIKACLYTWLYRGTRGSLLLMTIFHAADNTAGVFLPVQITGSWSSLNAWHILIGLELLAVFLVLAANGFTGNLEEKPVRAVYKAN